MYLYNPDSGLTIGRSTARSTARSARGGRGGGANPLSSYTSYLVIYDSGQVSLAYLLLSRHPSQSRTTLSLSPLRVVCFGFKSVGCGV